MFERTKDSFYKSLGKSIENRIEALALKRIDVFDEVSRISKIVNGKCDGHHPYLIGRKEYPYLYRLFICENKKSYEEETKREKKNYKNYDKMLWGHIDWDEMFRNVITELSEIDTSKDKKSKDKKSEDKKPKDKKSEDIRKLFEDTLVDYVPYAVIRYDELCPEYERIYIFPDERKTTRQKAIERVHFGRGKERFRKTFEKYFKGKTLLKFDREFYKVISEYLEESKPNVDSLGWQAYNFYKNLSKFVAYWQSLPEVQYAEENDKKSDLEKMLEEYIKDGREHMQKLIKYQQEFDDLYLDMK